MANFARIEDLALFRFILNMTIDYTEFFRMIVDQLSNIEDNTSNISVTNNLLEKLIKTVEDGNKGKEVSNPFVSGIDPDIDFIAQGLKRC